MSGSSRLALGMALGLGLGIGLYLLLARPVRRRAGLSADEKVATAGVQSSSSSSFPSSSFSSSSSSSSSFSSTSRSPSLPFSSFFSFSLDEWDKQISLCCDTCFGLTFLAYIDTGSSVTGSSVVSEHHDLLSQVCSPTEAVLVTVRWGSTIPADAAVAKRLSARCYQLVLRRQGRPVRTVACRYGAVTHMRVNRFDGLAQSQTVTGRELRTLLGQELVVELQVGIGTQQPSMEPQWLAVCQRHVIVPFYLPPSNPEHVLASPPDWAVRNLLDKCAGIPGREPEKQKILPDLGQMDPVGLARHVQRGIQEQLDQGPPRAGFVGPRGFGLELETLQAGPRLFGYRKHNPLLRALADRAMEGLQQLADPPSNDDKTLQVARSALQCVRLWNVQPDTMVRGFPPTNQQVR
eukprot:g66916.t1